MRQVYVGLVIGCFLSVTFGCADASTVTTDSDATVSVDTSGTDGSTEQDTTDNPDGSTTDTNTTDACEPNPCLNGGSCTTDSDGAAECACADGWEGDLCDADINECAADENPCGANGTCTNTDGGFDCACGEGWVADENGDCVDVDECADSPCGETEVCTNTDGGFECGCAEGYVAGEDGVCSDVDECAADESPCDPNASCTNTDGGYECACNEGWTTNEDGSCADVDECADEFPPCGENASCTNTDGSYECSCAEGYEGDGLECSDIDECAPIEALSEDFNAVDDEGNPVVPEGWAMFGSDMLEVDKEDPVMWHINADGQLQYSNKEGTNYNGTTTGAAALPSMDITEGDMIHASVSIQVGDQFSSYYDQAWIGFLACSTDVDFAGCLAALQEGALDENEEPIATLVPLWTKDDYNAAIDEAGLEAGAVIDVSVDLSPAAGWTGWLHFAFDSIDDYGNDGSGYIVDNVAVSKASQACGANEACANTDGAFECSCLEGFEADADGACVDVDECDGDVCAANEDCINAPGGFECVCSAGYAANEEGACVDMNECELGMAECDTNATCENTEGNYDCTCNDGFTGDGKTCANIDECAEGTDECADNATCVDGAPGTLCQGNTCDDEACQAAVGLFDGWCANNWDSSCATCAAGGATMFADCTALGDECEGVDYSVPYTCTCDDGYALNEDGLSCGDADECAGDESPCDVNATCTNNEGGYDCACNAGYTGDGATCADINECETDAYECDVNASCSNTDGAYECICNDGYVGDGKSCEQTANNECEDNNGGCAQTCTDLDDGFECGCNDGYVLGDDGTSCNDINECEDNNGGCAQLCKNEVGAFACFCNDGYTLGADGLACDDIDECANGENNCDANATCTNNDGGFSCACNDGYSGDGLACKADAPQCGETVKVYAKDVGADTLLSCQGGNDGFNFLCNYAGHGKFTGNAPEGDFNSGAPCWAVGEADGEVNTLYDNCGPGCTHYEYVECEAKCDAVDVSNGGDMVFGHHGNCEGWNDCGDAAGCAQKACNYYGYENAVDWDVVTHDDQTCSAYTWNLFNDDGSLDEGWNPCDFDCGLNGVANLTCSNAVAVNECENNNGGCAQTCTDLDDGFECSCNAGYVLGADGLACDDIDECADNNGGCAQLCKNDVGSFACACNDGYVLGADGLACDDIDECANGENNCDANATCTNNDGGFSCACNDGYSGDGLACKKDPVNCGAPVKVYAKDVGVDTLLSCQGGNDGFNFLCNYAGHGAFTGNAPEGDFNSGAPCWAVGEADGYVNESYPSCGPGCTHYEYVECEAKCEAVDVSNGGNMVFGHHGNCEGWNDCGDAAGCAQKACNYYGYENAVDWDVVTHNNQTCGAYTWNLFNDDGSLDEGWNPCDFDCQLNVVANLTCSK